MPRIIKRLKQHFERIKHVYLRVLIIVVTLIAFTLGAKLIVKKDGDHNATVKSMSGTPNEKYLLALDKVASGEVEEARVIMSRLARLSDTAEKPLGHGLAHLWVAQDRLPDFNTELMWMFPYLDTNQMTKMKLPKNGKIQKAQLHLEHAVAINPESESAVVLWASTLIAQGERNKALAVLMNAVAHSSRPHPKLHVPLANTLTMQGDDLALQERVWHLFSSSGKHTMLGRGSDVSERVIYILSALILRKYENADIAIRRLEARYPSNNSAVKPREGTSVAAGNKGDFVTEADRVSALRMAYHYHKAIDSFNKIRIEGTTNFKAVVDDLEYVVKLAPECEAAIDALTHIGRNDASQASRVKVILESILSDDGVKDEAVESKLYLSMAKLSSSSTNLRKEYLESAIESNPHNAEAILELADLLVDEDQPDYVEVGKFAKNALTTCRPVQRPKCYQLLGLSQMRSNKWADAVVSLEKSLVGPGEHGKTHALLAETYRALGQPQIAEEHVALSISKSR